MVQQQLSRTEQYRYLALAGYLGLMGWVILWHVSLSPHPHINPFTAAVAWTLPLLFPLRGILAGKAYTHAWANFVLMLYFTHALTLLYVDQGERWLALVELVLTFIAFISNILYARSKSKKLSKAKRS